MRKKNLTWTIIVAVYVLQISLDQNMTLGLQLYNSQSRKILSQFCKRNENILDADDNSKQDQQKRDLKKRLVPYRCKMLLKNNMTLKFRKLPFQIKGNGNSISTSNVYLHINSYHGQQKKKNSHNLDIKTKGTECLSLL